MTNKSRAGTTVVVRSFPPIAFWLMERTVFDADRFENRNVSAFDVLVECSRLVFCCRNPPQPVAQQVNSIKAGPSPEDNSEELLNIVNILWLVNRSEV
jgi:hypothetical protein